VSDPRRIWAVFLVIVVLIVGSYYEALSVRDSETHKVCVTTNEARQNLNNRSNALASYITTVLALNAAVQKVQPTPQKLASLQAQELKALRRLRSEQRPLPLVSCP
jgi:hypothetical protein